MLFKEWPKFIGESPLLTLVLAGTAAVALAPAVKNILRSIAVGTAKGVLSMAEGGAGLASNIKEGWQDLVAEARTQRDMSHMKDEVVGAGAGGAVGATIGSSLGGPVGAAVGGGVGSMLGVGLSSKDDTEEKQDQPEDK